MSIEKKKIFPKVKKKFQNFLTDESGKITKKWALWLSAGAALLATFDNVDAAIYHHNVAVDTAHSNVTSHASGYAHCSGSGRDYYCSGHSNVPNGAHSNTTYGNFYNIAVDYTPGVGCTQNHASGLVNGHANQAIDNGGTLTQTAINGITGHANHISHGNHGSGGWC